MCPIPMMAVCTPGVVSVYSMSSRPVTQQPFVGQKPLSVIYLATLPWRLPECCISTLNLHCSCSTQVFDKTIPVFKVFNQKYNPYL